MLFQKGDNVPSSLFHCPEGSRAVFGVSGCMLNNGGIIQIIADSPPQQGEEVIQIVEGTEKNPVQLVPIQIII